MQDSIFRVFAAYVYRVSIFFLFIFVFSQCLKEKAFQAFFPSRKSDKK